MLFQNGAIRHTVDVTSHEYALEISAVVRPLENLMFCR
jgi:hypothetical protein